MNTTQNIENKCIGLYALLTKANFVKCVIKLLLNMFGVLDAGMRFAVLENVFIATGGIFIMVKKNGIIKNIHLLV